MPFTLFADVCFSAEAVVLIAAVLAPVVAAISVLWIDGRAQRRDRIAALIAENDRLWAFVVRHDLGEEARREFESDE